MKYFFLATLAFVVLCEAKLPDGKERFIFYDVNPGEGFNLRRDVYMRMAVMVKKLNLKSEFNYTLILPPWGPFYHWQSHNLGDQIKIPWKTFFDLESMRRFVPVLDFEDYIKLGNDPFIDVVYYLQNYKEGWSSGEFVEKYDFRDCIDKPERYNRDDNGNYDGVFWYYHQVRARRYKCISVQGSTAIFRDFLNQVAKENKGIMLDRAEQLLHDYFGDEDYWAARRSMRFATHLVEVADEFRAQKLESRDETDHTVLEEKWEHQQPKPGSAEGGPYICAHLRRRDYVHSRHDQIPSIQGAAEQLGRKLKEHNLNMVFVSTDAPVEEFRQLQQLLQNSEYKVVKFEPPRDVMIRYKDGGVAIIDQTICSHARYFLGSHESTFTFRIQEEREIMGFSVDKTFDMFCPDGKFDCARGSVWRIVYPDAKLKHEEL